MQRRVWEWWRGRAVGTTRETQDSLKVRIKNVMQKRCTLSRPKQNSTLNGDFRRVHLTDIE